MGGLKLSDARTLGQAICTRVSPALAPLESFDASEERWIQNGQALIIEADPLPINQSVNRSV